MTAYLLSANDSCISVTSHKLTSANPMKRQISLLFSGAVVGVVTFTTTALAEPLSQNSVSEKALPIQLSLVKNRPGSAMSAVEELDLTAAQQEEIDTIRSSIAEQMAEVLTPEQAEAFAAAQADGGNMRSVMMNLDRSQRSSVMDIMRTTESDIMDVLTPEQRAKIGGARPIDRN